MSQARDPELRAYRLPQESGQGEPLPAELDTAEGWRARARLVRPEAEPAGQVPVGDAWVQVFHRRDTVPIESDADLDATSAYPRASSRPGIYDYGWSPASTGEDDH